MYTHDSSDGRNRLVWSKDEENVVTIYGYGADGLEWSVCNGEYIFYHYDYRGSVVAVTNIDCTVTDKIKYDAYGSVAERTGTTEIIFGYNGKYGVLSDPNGLLYMRSRYYNPELKRFMNADVLDGSIADSTTLNLYAYVNGNPISFVDPFGFCGRDSQNTTSNSDSMRYGNYILGGMELAPTFGPYDNDFPYDPEEVATLEDYINWYIWNGVGSASGMPVWIKQLLKDPVAEIIPEEVYERYSSLFDEDLSDAAEAYMRYLSGTGKSLKIDYGKAYNESSKLQSIYETQLSIMCAAAEKFYESGAGTNFEIIGDLIEIDGSLGSQNWDKTIGAHYAYGYAQVSIDSNTGYATIKATFTMEDMYNFNRGMYDIATGTPDDINGRFQTLGWAEQFITYGSFTISSKWAIK